MDDDSGSEPRYLFSEAAQYDAFKATARATPVLMVNLVRFHDRARYQAAHPDAALGRSGAEAFAVYRDMVAPLMAHVGGRQSAGGVDGLTMIGPPGERWDYLSVNEYPSVDAFLAMMRDPDYRAASKHRQAAIADSRTIRFLPPAGPAA